MKKSLIFIFPGQGSQKVGMGLDLYNNHHIAREVFDEVDDSLNQKLSKIIFNGPEELLTTTSNTQPALMSVSIAIIRIIEHELKKNIDNFVKIVLGHSLGEYSSLCSIKTLNLADTAKLLRTRGDAMQNAVQKLETKMVAVLGLDIKEIDGVINNFRLKKNSVCQIANDNCPGQVILSGTTDAVDLIASKLKKHGAKGFINLNVSAPFHCALMSPASKIMEKAIRETVFKKLSTKFISNVTANYETEIDRIKQLLVEQIYSRVKWRESILLADKDNSQKIIEIGSGKVLSGINKRIGVKMEIENISTISDIEDFLNRNKDFL